jgi:hypothetical protein
VLLDAAGLDRIETVGAEADAAAFGHRNIWRPTRGVRRIGEL